MITGVGRHPQTEQMKMLRVRQEVQSNHHLTVRMTAVELGMNSERLWRITTKNLCKNGTKVAEQRTKGAARASVSRHFGAT